MTRVFQLCAALARLSRFRGIPVRGVRDAPLSNRPSAPSVAPALLARDRWTVPFFFLLQTAALGLLLPASAPWHVGVFAFLFGVEFGGSYPARATVVAERIATQAYGQINGLIAFLMTLTAALGVLVMSAVTARFSTLDDAMLFVECGSVIAVVAIVSLVVFSPMTHRPVSGQPEFQQAR